MGKFQSPGCKPDTEHSGGILGLMLERLRLRGWLPTGETPCWNLGVPSGGCFPVSTLQTESQRARGEIFPIASGVPFPQGSWLGKVVPRRLARERPARESLTQGKSSTPANPGGGG